ncbi:hypothetical protein [Nocardioides endophyticus]
MLRSVRRATALVAVPALTALVLVATPTAATAAEPSPSGSASTWLTGQLTGGEIVGEFGPDYGLSIDTAVALAAVGGHQSDVVAVRDALAAHVESYTTGDAFGDVDSQYAGATAKAMWFARLSGGNPHAFGGVDLQTQLESLVTTTGPSTGRIVDQSSYGDYANALGQIFAARGLAQGSSPLAADVRSFLLKQQCAAGFFRLSFTESAGAADQTCDGGTATESAPDTDVTALFVIALHDDAAVAAPVAAATAWLKQQQLGDGSFGGGPSTEAPNANSTGLAGWALGEVGDTAGAKKAAVWVKAHQVVNAGACAQYAAADTGSIAYDDAALTALVTKPIAPATRDKARRATAQAIPVLKWAPAGTGTNVLFTSEYVRAGTTPSVGVTGAAPGDALCATTPDGQKLAATANAAGEAQFPIKLGTRTSTTVVTVANAAGVVDTATIKALGAKKLGITTKAKVRKGKTVKVLVRGLAPAESVVVKVGGKKKAGQANGKGRFVAKVKATKRGKTKVVVRGEFANRKGTKTIRVVR